MLPQAAAEHYRAQQRLIVATLGLTRREWAAMGEDFDASWAKVGPRITLLTASAQMGAARNGAAYVPATLAELGQSVDPFAEVDPRGFAGIASDGRPLDSLLLGGVITAKEAAPTMEPQAALAAGGKWLDMAIHTQVADAGRGAASAAIAARPKVGWIRMVNPPCCSRCAILSGKWFKWNEGFKRHPRCFPAGVVVSGPQTEAATRRRYQGELVVLTTASGQELPLTGNHPVLTSRGWVPANLLQEGDEVVRSTRSEGAAALIVPDHDQMPSRIEDVWGALRVESLTTVESSPEDFHGDGQYGQVDVVRADGTFDDRLLLAFTEQCEQGDFTGASIASFALAQEGGPALLDFGHSTFPTGPVGSNGLVLALGLAHLTHANEASFAGAPSMHPGRDQPFSDRPARDAVLLRERVLAGTSEVSLHDLLCGQVQSLPRWDAPGDSFTVETAAGYTRQGRDLLNRLSGQVELDRVVKLRRGEWSGHVYSLTSVEGWHVANSLIVSNCDCYHVPAREMTDDIGFAPDDLILEGKVTGITKAEQRAIGDGADAIAVLNARRGAQGMWTTEGTTRRGYASYVKRELDKQRGVITKETATKVGRRGYIENYTVRRVSPRPTIEAIYKYSGSREEAVKLMAQNGYIVGGSIRDVAARAL